ncbi:MAG: 50S ribosomal protein L14e [archaeon]
MEVGTVCIKTKGRDAGGIAVVLSKASAGRVLIDGPKVKRKNINVLHLFPIGKTVKVKEEESHEKVISALKGLKE